MKNATAGFGKSVRRYFNRLVAQHLSVIFFFQLLHRFSNGDDCFCLIGVGAGKREPMSKVSLCCVKQCFGDAELNFLVVACLQTLPGTPHRLLCTLLNLPYKIIDDHPAGKADRAINQYNIVLLTVDIILLEFYRDITLSGGYKPGTHLHGFGTRLQYIVHITTGIDTTSCNHRDLPACCLLEMIHIRDSLFHNRVE